MNKIKLAGIALLLLGLGVAIGRYTLPEKVKIVKEYVEVVKEVVKEVKNKDSNASNKQQIHIVETTFPDGKYTKETFIINESTVVIREQVTVEVEKMKEVLKRELKETKGYKPQWAVAGLYNFKNDYGVMAERRIIGPIFGGVFYNNVQTTKDLGASLKVEF